MVSLGILGRTTTTLESFQRGLGNTLGTNTGSIRTTSDTRTVSVTLLPFMRSRKIFFFARGLLPNTTHKPFFDGVDVSSWCREETFTRISDITTQDSTTANNTATAHPEGNSALISNSDGEIEGSFFLPNTSSLRFRAGTKEFKLRDEDATTDANAISAAFASYTSQGTLETRQTTITETITLRPPPPPPPRRRRDPVAQSFVIERSTGAYITSVDACFQTVSSTVPIRCEIRPMVAGLPAADPLPGAEVWVNASAMSGKNTNTPNFNNASDFATFTFPEPIYLEGFVEYAVVFLADTTDYTIWTAVMKDFKVGSTTQRVMKQPTMGSFFKSQNGSTWTPDQNRDMMFRIKRANFTTSGLSGTAYFENVASLPVKKLGSNPFTTTNSSQVVLVNHPNHGMPNGASVTIAGATATNGIPIGELNTTHTITTKTLDSYTITTSTTAATSAGSGGGTAVTATEDYMYNLANFMINSQTIPGTAISWSAKTTTGQSIAGAETAYTKDSSYTAMFPNENNIYSTTRNLPSSVNATASLGGQRGLAIKADLSTTSSVISPVIDLQRMSAILVGNRVDRPAAASATGFNVPNTFVAETTTLTTSDTNIHSAAKHITEQVTFEEPAVGFKLLFAANRPSDSYITVYYKTLPSGSDTPFSDLDWTEATIDETVQTDDDPLIFREYAYTVDEDQFTSIKFKFVFTSSNSANVPRVRDMRVIALSS